MQIFDLCIEEAQHFRKIAVKSVFSEVWFLSDCRREIICKVAVEDSCFEMLYLYTFFASCALAGLELRIVRTMNS